MSFKTSTAQIRVAVAVLSALVLLAVGALLARPSGAQPSIGQLSSRLEQQRARAQGLAAGVAALSGVIARLDGEISFVQAREATVQAALATDRAALAGVQRALVVEQARVALLNARLARARSALARQLVSGYEGDKPDLVRVVLEAHGFTDLLERMDFLHRAMAQQQAIIHVTRAAKAQADAAARDLARIEARDRGITQTEALRSAALAGMGSLLQGRQAAVARARAAERAALTATRTRGAQLQAAISKLQAEQAAAQRAAADAGAGGGSGGPSLGPSARWAIPYAIVLCESGGQNLPPNSAGASGYYQIIPSTWSSFGGSGPAAYLASKGEQDAVASRIWNGGAGASNWVCAGMVGIH
jgi:septal ring factor EnvC (AmiA/AmiB activator)